jgi:hypothetical protein
MFAIAAAVRILQHGRTVDFAVLGLCSSLTACFELPAAQLTALAACLAATRSRTAALTAFLPPLHSPSHCSSPPITPGRRQLQTVLCHLRIRNLSLHPSRHPQLLDGTTRSRRQHRTTSGLTCSTACSVTTDCCRTCPLLLLAVLGGGLACRQIFPTSPLPAGRHSPHTRRSSSRPSAGCWPSPPPSPPSSHSAST